MTLEESIQIAVEGCGVSLYDIVNLKENDNNIYRVYITSSEGISLDKCAEVSRQISPLLDVHEPLSGKYNLEVSSPGIERKLKRPAHFKASINENIRIKDFEKNILEGKLLRADDNEIVLQTEHGEEIISYDEISLASTYYEW
ncbi:MAG: ribosome maturation factor RimP [Arcobacteraceae bacterium]|jgi:ribosome maturation factor RimP|nr:ribosome maturation factor RimP [Arcobacteraceae bacterium]